MSKLLSDLLTAGLIENLNGDDDRFAKMGRAVEEIAKDLRENPPRLIRSILAALDPDVPEDDPAIVMAERALVDQWPTMSSAHPSTPVGLLRALLLDACNAATEAEGANAAIVLFTAVDTLPLLKLGREEPVVRKILVNLAIRVEQEAVRAPAAPSVKRLPTFKAPEAREFDAHEPALVDRDNLWSLVASAACNSHPSVQVNNPNPYWPNNPTNWSHEFANRMHSLLADEFNGLAEAITGDVNDLKQQLQGSQTELIKAITESMAAQRRWIQDVIDGSETERLAEKTKLNTLWWYEALYSPSMCCSYREHPPPLASVVMAIDLISGVSHPSPASVAYVLSEAVNRLPEASFSCEYKLTDLLFVIRQGRTALPMGWFDRLLPPPVAGRLSLRDLVVSVLSDRDVDVSSAIKDAGLSEDTKFSLPMFARAMFRQEQAVQLAEQGK